jgi:glyceraldehyde 3-phosphate dehydrogenase
MTKVAINGFGRIGRLALRRILENHPDLEVTAVNDLGDLETTAFLLKRDSVYGSLKKEISLRKGVKGAIGALSIESKSILVFGESDPLKLPWEELGVQVVIESSGRFTTRKEAKKHLEAGAKKVIISANAKDADVSIVLGVNEKDYDPKKHEIISNCSCTTNCAAPVMKILDEKFGVEKAQLTTVHAVTASQSLVDGPKKDKREGRAAFSNIIPASTGADEAVVRVLPKLEGKISGSAFRVPVLCGSVLEVVAQIKKETSVDEVNKVFEKAAENELKGILEVSRENLVSSDIIGTNFSAIVDLPLTEVMNLPNVKDQNLIKVVAWYDNEYGYACRLAELAEFVAKKL